MDSTTRMIEVARDGDTLVLTPTRDLGDLDYDRIEAEADALLKLLNGSSTRGVVVDFARTDYFGSAALGLLVQLGQQVRGRGGRLVLCNVSAHEDEVLHVTRLAGMWPIYSSRAEALAALTNGRAAPPK